MLLQVVVKLLGPQDDAVDAQRAVVVQTLTGSDAAVDTQVGVVVTRSGVGHREGEVTKIDGVDLGGIADEV